MSEVRVRLLSSLQKQLSECANKEGTSIDQLISSAIAEKLAALLSPAYLDTRAKRGSRQKFEAALMRVPDVEPPKFDRLTKRPRSVKKRGPGGHGNGNR